VWHVGDLTSIKNEDISLYISGCKPQFYKLVSWNWVRLKVHSVIWHEQYNLSDKNLTWNSRILTYINGDLFKIYIVRILNC